MKNFKLLLSLFLFLAVFSEIIAEMQIIEPCYLNNQNDLYLGPFYIMDEVPECPGCYFTYQYYWRESGNFRDIQITAWELDEESDPSCLNCDVSDIFAAGIKAIWDFNIMLWDKFDPINGNCHWNFTATLYSCMIYDINPIEDPPMGKVNHRFSQKSNMCHEDEIRTFYPCNSICCAAAYEVCFDEFTGNVISIQFLSHLSYHDECNPSYPNCLPVCDELVIEYDVSVIQYNSKIKRRNNMSESVNFIPNPTENNGSILFKTLETGSVKLIIFNEFGKIQYIKHYVKKSYEMIIPVDENIITGKYNYQIILNDKIFSGNFLIIR